MSDRHNEQNNEVTEKLEISADPLQAMLFDMIPSLATQKVEQPMNRSVREEKLPETSNAEAEPMTTKKEKKGQRRENNKMSASAQKGEVESALMAREQLLVLMYKDVYFTNDLNFSLPCEVVSLL